MNENQRLSHWKRQYNEIPVPQEAADRVRAGIAEGKQALKEESKVKESRAKEKDRAGRGGALRILRRGGMTAAAAVFAIVVLSNADPSIANAMERIPVIGAVARVVTLRTYQNKTNQFEADISVPQVETGEKTAAANKSIQEYADELIASYESELKAANGEGNYTLKSTYRVVSDQEKYLSIRIDTVQVMASGAQYVKIFTIDKSTGEVVTLSELLANQPGMLERISEEIKRQMEQQMEADQNVQYFLNSDMPDEDFKGLKGDESYYFNDKGELVIAFDEYEVAPGYMGAVEFTIPQSVTGKLV